MKVQQSKNLQLNTSPQKPPKVSFTGGEYLTQFLRFLDTNQAWGATLIDVGCMGAPRSAVDFTRSPEAGVETMRREFSSTINNSLIGSYGIASAFLFSHVFNKEFGVKAYQMLINDDMLDILSHTWHKERNIRGFLHSILQSTRGFNPEQKGNIEGWVEIDETVKEKIIKKLIEDAGKSKAKAEATKQYINALLLESTGAETRFKIEKQIGKTTKVKSISSLKDFVETIYKFTQTFKNPKVQKTFENTDFRQNKFIKRLKSINIKTAISGMLLAGLVGISLQPVNMYLTRKKTGKAGFVGVEGREPDNSKGFKILKNCFGVLAAIGALSTIGKNPSEILRKIQFKGFAPVLDQFKFVYGMTVASRLVSARDKNELRETSIKDSLGFFSWLILGGVVSKITALTLEKIVKFKNESNKFILYHKDTNGEGLGAFFNKLAKSSIITRDEVLYSAFKKAGASSVRNNNTVLSFNEMLKRVPLETRKKIKLLGLIQAAGYLYSGILLGAGIPKLNIAITNAVEKKNKTEQKKETNINKNLTLKLNK